MYEKIVIFILVTFLIVPVQAVKKYDKYGKKNNTTSVDSAPKNIKIKTVDEAVQQLILIRNTSAQSLYVQNYLHVEISKSIDWGLAIECEKSFKNFLDINYCQSQPYKYDSFVNTGKNF